MSSPIYLTSKTSIETDWSCPMKWWWQKHEGGTGIIPAVEPAYFLEGRQLHSDLEPYARGATVGQVMEGLPSLESVAPDQIALELLCRRIGFAAAFGLYIEPILRDGADEVLVEDEIILERDPLWISAKPDRVQRGHGQGLRWREWKSTSTTRQEWVQSWAYSPQLHIGLAALGEELKEKLDFASILGFYKGHDQGGKLHHPYVWAYRSPQGKWSADYTYGWEKVGVWEYAGGVEQWVRDCGEDVSRRVFLWSAPVFLDERIVNSIVLAQTERMREVGEVKGACQAIWELRQLHFPQHFNECRPPYGSACSYLGACHNASVNADPVGSGMYRVRPIHTEVENE